MKQKKIKKHQESETLQTEAKEIETPIHDEKKSLSSKKIFTAMLLTFVGVSVAFLVFKEYRDARAVSPPSVSSLPATETPSPATTTAKATTTDDTKTVVYYFHGQVRCVTCRKIEALTQAAVRTHFSEELKRGAIELQTINAELPQNQNFIYNYQLSSPSVVISKQQKGTEKDWKRLDMVWRLVSDQRSFMEYVRSEINAIRS